jgi:signal peptidase I
VAPVVVYASTLAIGLGLVFFLGTRRTLVTVRGHSMFPTLRDGQIVVSRRRLGAACRIGDIIVFRTPQFVLARGIHSDLLFRIERVVAVAGDPLPVWLQELTRGIRKGLFHLGT